MSKLIECPDEHKMSFKLSCAHRVHAEDAVKLLHCKLCPVCHRILKTDDVLVLVEHLREIGFFYGNGQEADVCGVNLVEPKRKRRQAELSPAKRLRRDGLSHEKYLSYLEDRVPSDDEDIQEYSPPSPCYVPCESGDDDD
ncbi:hypothetical protein AVEN_77178-1 [Araneus ventricosus]|uniref:Uncharacterized protein n=1 Tax=Araneus ventricosus TaxID=182803 RepID=A0A4Y1ZW98_ARAVE|nr:hypothetical protein AVEN_77178-1 [Araneus ventricosus]